LFRLRVCTARISSPRWTAGCRHERGLVNGRYNWRYVKSNDLERYRTLWHSDFLGWPTTSPVPVRKEHITDWITAHTSKGEILKSYDLERLEAQQTGDDVTVTYRIHTTWVGKDGVDKPSISRIIHTWRHNSDRTWKIISGMGAYADAQGH
jgi:ketosteroid isomerase-like protein